jgi:Ca-activated chloride channel homolog
LVKTVRILSIRHGLEGVLFVLCSLGFHGNTYCQEPPYIYRFGVRVEMVSIFATVLDRAGRLVTGLNRDDFLVYDNGERQAVSQFSREYIPVSVVILLDTSSSMLSGKKLDNAKRALAQFLKRLHKGDEAMLMTFRTRPRVVVGFTQDLERLRREVRRVDGNGSTALYDAVLASLEEIVKARNPRRTLLLITDGLNTYGRAQLQETVNRLQIAGVELFAIGLESNLPEDLQDKAVTRSILEHLTKSAGGEAFALNDPKHLGSICGTISERIHNQYTFGYYPSPLLDSRWHAVRVETRVPGLRVIASKTGYYPVIDREARSH